MSKLHFCQELQRFLERQWQKVRGILAQEAAEISQENLSLHNGWNLPEMSSLEDSGNDVEQEVDSIGSCDSSDDESVPGENIQQDPVVGSLLDYPTNSLEGNAIRSALWTGSLDVINEQFSDVDIASIIDIICETLTNLLDAGYGYKKQYILLLEALLKLLTSLKDVEREHPEALKRSGLFSQLKVSVSITYALVEKVSARQTLSIFFFKFRRLACAPQDAVRAELTNQIFETKTLLREVRGTSELYDHANLPVQVTAYRAETSHPQPVYGVNLLTVAAGHDRSAVSSGDKVTFLIRDSDINVVYAVQTWLNNPDSLFHRAKRLSASVQCSSGKVFNIGVPGYPNKETDLQNRTALIVSGFEQAQVRSFLPGAAKRTMGSSKRKAEALLQEDPPYAGDHESSMTRKKCAGELLVHSKPKHQKYRGEIAMSNMILNLDCMGQPLEVRKLGLEGKKYKTKVWYRCYVELTGEVLAIYRHKRRTNEGVFHTLGIGNEPQLRDIIICSFVAMGLNSFL